MADFKSQVAGYLRTQFSMPLEATDDDILDYARKTDQKAFDAIVDEAYGPKIKEVYKEPSTAKNVLDTALSLPGAYNAAIKANAAEGGPLNYPSTVVNALSEGVSALGRGISSLDKITGTGPKGETGGMFQSVGDMLQMSPTDVTLSALPFEKAAGPALKKIGKAGNKIIEVGGNLFEAGVDKAPIRWLGANIFKDAWLASKTAANSRIRAIEQIAQHNEVAQKLMSQLGVARARLVAGLSDASEFGGSLRKTLAATTEAAKTPLKLASKALENTTEKLGVATVQTLAPSIQKIKDDLLGIVQIAPDSPVLNVLNKYLGKKVVPDDLGNIFDHKKGLFRARTAEEAAVTVFPEASIKDLLQDRGRVGKLYVDSLEAGQRNTPQSTALLQIQQVLDNEIESRAKDTPGLIESIKTARANWSNFYKKYYSDHAVKFRSGDASAVVDKMLVSSESVDTAKALVPALMPEARRVKKVELFKLIDKSDDAGRLLADEFAGVGTKEKGYYDRLFTPQDKEELLNYSRLGKESKLANKRADELNKVLQEAVPANRKGESLAYAGRVGDPKTEAEALKRAFTRNAIPMTGSSIATAMGVGALISSKRRGLAATLAAINVAPAAFSYLYFRGDRAMRTAMISAVKNIEDLGAKKAVRDVAFLTKIGVINSDNKPSGIDVPQDKSLGKLSSLRKKEEQPVTETQPVRVGESGLDLGSLGPPGGGADAIISPEVDEQPEPLEDYYDR